MDHYHDKKLKMQRRARYFKATRWLHLHLSLFSFLLLLIFSITGFTLHHADWLDPRTLDEQTIEQALSAGQLVHPEREAIGAELKSKIRLKGSLSAFDAGDDMIQVVYAAPGYRAEIQIDRKTNKAVVSIERGWLTAILNDIHTGKNARPAEGLLIDGAAILIAFVALSGLALTCFLHLRSRAPWISLTVGAVLAAGIILGMAFL